MLIRVLSSDWSISIQVERKIFLHRMLEMNTNFFSNYKLDGIQSVHDYDYPLQCKHFYMELKLEIVGTH
jgi:hypothetical protein